MNKGKTALLLIDIQDGLDEFDYYGGERNNPQAEENCRIILDLFRNRDWPVFHIQHNSTHQDSPLYPGKPGHRIKEIVTPSQDERVIQKNVNSAFVGTGLDELLKSEGISSLVVVGLTTEHCVSTSVRMAANLGYHVTLISDATAAFNKTGVMGEAYAAEVVHLTTLATLKDEFAVIVDTQVLMESLAVKEPGSSN